MQSDKLMHVVSTLANSVLINAHCKPANYVYRTFANSTYALYQWCLCKPCVNHQVWCTNTIVEQSSNHFDCIVAFLSVQLREALEIRVTFIAQLVCLPRAFVF